jgi:hypothetical protein
MATVIDSPIEALYFISVNDLYLLTPPEHLNLNFTEICILGVHQFRRRVGILSGSYVFIHDNFSEFRARFILDFGFWILDFGLLG